ALEDLGWFVIDNLPPALIGKVTELVGRPGSETEKVALVVGRGGEGVEELVPAIEQLRRSSERVRILFLDAADDALVRRFEGTRRRHPVFGEGVVEGIRRERSLLNPIKETADIVIDTSDLNVHQLRERLVDFFTHDDPAAAMQVTVVSFGYKNGLPLDLDNVIDCRFLPNPHWVDELRPMTGLDEPVREYVLGQPETKEFLDKLDELFGLLLPLYVREGKSYLSIGVGCTGGHHRSVVLAEELARRISDLGFNPLVVHRDVNR
ncbi:MAG: RNase adapter protein RapZ, partial [Actinomycetota bacterium]|nr:RNase adapter protein RapZ [Actinomycetota bacterium]